MDEKRIWRLSQILVCLTFLFQAASVFASQSERFPVGARLPQPALGVPDSADVQKYLGLKSGERFRLTDIGSKLVLIDLIAAM